MLSSLAQELQVCTPHSSVSPYKSTITLLVSLASVGILHSLCLCLSRFISGMLLSFGTPSCRDSCGVDRHCSLGEGLAVLPPFAASPRKAVAQAHSSLQFRARRSRNPAPSLAAPCQLPRACAWEQCAHFHPLFFLQPRGSSPDHPVTPGALPRFAT